MRHEDVYVNLVNQFNGILAVRIVLVINSFEQRIALPIQILLRDEGVPAKYRLSDLMVCIEVEFHGDWSIICRMTSFSCQEIWTNVKKRLPQFSLILRQPLFRMVGVEGEGVAAKTLIEGGTARRVI